MQPATEIPIKKEKNVKKTKKSSDKRSIPVIDEDISLPLISGSSKINNSNNQNNLDNNLQPSNSIPTIVVSNSNTRIGDDSV